MATYEVIIQIEVIGDEIEMSLLSESGGGSLPGGQADQKTRRGRADKKNDVKKQKKERHNSNHQHPDVVGPHLPIWLFNHSGGDDDKITFRCASDFVVDVSLDDGFDPPGGAHSAPLNPFGWMTPQKANGGTDISGTINKASFTGIGGGAGRMDFYKCTVWTQGKKLDPDLICEAGP